MEIFPTQKPTRKPGVLGHLEGGYKLPEVNSENVKKTMEALSSIFKELPDAEQVADWLFKGGICKKLLELGKEIEENTPEDVKETAGKIAGGILGGAVGGAMKTVETGVEIAENIPNETKETAGKIAGGILGGAFGQLLKWQA